MYVSVVASTGSSCDNSCYVHPQVVYNDTHCPLLSIPAFRPGTMLYYVHEQHIFICDFSTLYLTSSPNGRCDMDIMLCILIYDYCIISLFTEMVLHVSMLVFYSTRYVCSGGMHFGLGVCHGRIIDYLT